LTITHSPAREVSDLEAQALFKEARRRRHRRWFFGVVLVLVVSLAVALIVSMDSGAPRQISPGHVGLPRWTPPRGKARAAPALFVAGDGNGGVGVYSTTNGALIRTISPQGPGGPDQQVALSRNRQTVYFTQPNGLCSGNILSGPVSGSSAPGVVISDTQTLALSPSPSPTSGDLAWVGVTCGPTGTTTRTTLYITTLTTGARSDLGALSGQHGDDGIAWSPDGTRLAVESGTTVAVFDTDQSPPEELGRLDVASGCTLTSPTFLPQPNELAAIRTCDGTTRTSGTSEVLAFNVVTGKPVAVVASAPHGATFQGLSVDASGQHILLGVVTSSPLGAHNMALKGKRLVPLRGQAPTDAEW
jgi:hypothetical protein